VTKPAKHSLLRFTLEKEGIRGKFFFLLRGRNTNTRNPPGGKKKKGVRTAYSLFPIKEKKPVGIKAEEKKKKKRRRKRYAFEFLFCFHEDAQGPEGRKKRGRGSRLLRLCEKGGEGRGKEDMHHFDLFIFFCWQRKKKKGGGGFPTVPTSGKFAKKKERGEQRGAGCA